MRILVSDGIEAEDLAREVATEALPLSGFMPATIGVDDDGIWTIGRAGGEQPPMFPSEYRAFVGAPPRSVQTVKTSVVE